MSNPYTAEHMRADLDRFKTTGDGARLTLGAISRALAMSRPRIEDGHAMKQWRLSVDFFADALREKQPHFNRKSFIERCSV